MKLTVLTNQRFKKHVKITQEKRMVKLTTEQAHLYGDTGVPQ